MKNVFTTSVPVSPKNLPTTNSQRRTGRDSTVYSVRLSISFETRPIPMKMAMTTPKRDTAVSPRLTTTSRSISIETSPTRIAAPESSSANAIRLYSTRSRTASRKVLKAIYPMREFIRPLPFGSPLSALFFRFSVGRSFWM